MIKFTTLVIFCSLVSLPIVEAETKPIEGCGTIYKCFVPESCIKENNFVADETEVAEVVEDMRVTTDCAAIIRFHSYSKYLVHASIESLSTATSIVFKQRSSSAPTKIVSFGCKVDNGVVEAQYNRFGIDRTDATEMKGSKESLLKCTFEVKLTTEKVLLFQGSSTEVQFQIDKSASKWTGDRYIERLRCDPLMFIYNAENNFQPYETYAKVGYSPDRYECENKDLYTRMEYHLENSDTYKTVKEIKCNINKFTITEEGSPTKIEMLFGDRFYVRCVADVKFACNYTVNTIKLPSIDPNFAGPIYKMPMPITQPGEIKCPETHPFMELKRKVISGEIKCKNIGGVPQWTINDIHLRKKGAEVRCAKELRCHEFKKLPVSSIKNGSLINHVPTCREKEIMKVLPSMDKVSNIYCNTTTGNFEYTIGDEKLLAENSTFVCEYNRPEREIATGVTSVMSAVAVLVFLLLLAAISNCLMYFLKKRSLKKEKEEWESIFPGKDTKKNMKMKKELQTKQSGKKRKITTDTSEIIPHHLKTCQLSMNIESPSGNEYWEMFPRFKSYHLDEEYDDEVKASEQLMDRRKITINKDENWSTDNLKDFMNDMKHFETNDYPKKITNSHDLENFKEIN